MRPGTRRQSRATSTSTTRRLIRSPRRSSAETRGDATNQFRVTWTNPARHAAPIVRAHWKLCTTDGTCPCTRAARWRRIFSELPSLTRARRRRLPAARLARGRRGQRSARRAPPSAAALRFDPEPPQLTFEPTDIRPTRCGWSSTRSTVTRAWRAEKSRCARRDVEWHGLATEREGSLLVAHVDDERFRNGAYEFRAHAVDQAGNEASTGRRDDGSAATLRLPARIDTRLAVGVPRIIVRRRVERRHGHRRVMRRRIRRLDSNVDCASTDALVRLDGFLANADGQPIDGATIEALEKRPDGASCPVGLATTGTDGKFQLRR